MRLAGAVVVAVLGATACTQPGLVDRPSGDPDPHHRTIPVVTAAPDTDAVSVLEIDLPAWLGEPDAVLVGDALAGPADEAVVIGAGGFVTLAPGGRVLGRYQAPAGTVVPGTLSDVDRDGKVDVILGSVHGADPVLTAWNARGRLIASRRLVYQNDVFGSIRPVGSLADGIVVVAEEHWIAGPRGVVLADGRSMEPLWFSAVPTGLLGGSVAADWIVISNYTQHNGEFSVLGTEKRHAFGFDARPQLVLLDPAGAPYTSPLGLTNEAVEQTVVALPLGHARVLLHVEGERGELVVADATDGRTRAAVGLPRGATTSVAVAGGGDGHARVVVVHGARDAWDTVVLSADLDELARWTGGGPAPVPLALIDAAESPIVLARRGDGLILMGDARTMPSAGSVFGDGDAAVELHAVVREETHAIVVFVAAAGRLTVVRVPLERA